MDQLYKKILQGTYPSLPTRYSNELSSIVKVCLQQSPQSRPTCEKLLQMEGLTKKLIDSLRMNDVETNKNLMGTIKLDRNQKVLQQHLPKSSYSRHNSRKKDEKRNVTSQQSSREKDVIISGSQKESKNEHMKAEKPKRENKPLLISEANISPKEKPISKNDPYMLKLSIPSQKEKQIIINVHTKEPYISPRDISLNRKEQILTPKNDHRQQVIKDENRALYEHTKE